MRICVCTESTLIGHMIQRCQEYIDVISATFVPANFSVAECQSVLCTTGIQYLFDTGLVSCNALDVNKVNNF